MVKDIDDWKVRVSLRIERLLTGSDTHEEKILKDMIRLVDYVEDPELLAELEYCAHLMAKVRDTAKLINNEYEKLNAQMDAILALIRTLNEYLDILSARKRVLNEIKELNSQVIQEVEDKVRSLKYV